MSTTFATKPAFAASGSDRLAQMAQAQFAAQSRATVAPVFSDVSRFSEPSATRMVWMPSTNGHPTFV